MSQAESNHDFFDSLSAESMLKINRLCDEFEAAWNRGQLVELSQFMSQHHATMTTLNAEEHAVLGMELISLDQEYRAKHQLPIDQTMYRKLFPDVDTKLDVSIQHRIDTAAIEHGLHNGQLLGDYRILSRIGSGGMGYVYQAEHELMKRKVAIKCLATKIRNDPQAQRRFEREVMSLAALSHPNIVAAFDARREGPLLYLVTEWIDGVDLAQHVRRNGPLTVQSAIECCKQAAMGLHYAHQHGIIHRDVKPSNLVMQSNGVVKLLDLGLAKVIWEANDESAATNALTKSTLLLGTASFISPEQARNPLAIDARSDIYSLGCTLYFLLAGHAPYQAEHAVDLLAAHLNAPIPKLSEKRASLPKGLSDFVESMMAKSSQERPENMAQVASMLERFQTEEVEPQSLEVPSLHQVSSQPVAKVAINHRSKPWAWITLAAMILLMLGLISILPKSITSIGNGSAGEVVGLTMNGRSSFAQVTDFERALGDSVMLEAVVTPASGPMPSNMVAWTGANSFILFMSQDRRWGGALYWNGRSYLRVSNEPLVLGQQRTLAARWQQGQVVLFEEGMQIESRELQYTLGPARTALCFGGTPIGMFPADEGRRFFTGTIHKLHVSEGENLTPFSNASQYQVNRNSVALFELQEGQGDVAEDRSANRYRAQLVDAQWSVRE